MGKTKQKPNLKKPRTLQKSKSPSTGVLKAFVVSVLVLTILALTFLVYVYPILKSATSCYAKTLCSATFVSKRNPEFVDLGLECSASILPLIAYGEVNGLTQSVTAKIKYLPVSATAYFKNTCLGCSLDDTIYNGSFNEDANKVECNVKPKPLESIEDSMSEEKIKRIVDPYFQNSTFNTREFVVLKDGKLLYEQYAPGYNKDTPLLGWSMTKSILNALIGIRVKDKKLSLDDKASKFIPQWKNDNRQNITIDDLLRMTSGLEWAEVHGVFNTDVVPMLYYEITSHFRALSKPLDYSEDKPSWYYSSGTSNILSWILRQTFDNDMDYYRFPTERLFNEIGADAFSLETDPFGTYVLSSFSYGSARDWAKFGQLYLNNGKVSNKQIFPENWVKYTTSPTPNSYGLYGAHWWRGDVDEYVHESERDLGDLYRPMPKDAYFASGYSGQYTIVVPSLNLVIVRLGYNTPGVRFPIGEVVRDIVQTLKK